MQLFSMGSELSRSGEPGSCSQICNWNFHKDQQPSTNARGKATRKLIDEVKIQELVLLAKLAELETKQ